MKTERRFKSTLTTLLFVAISAALLLAQDQGSAPPYGQDQSPAYGQDQSGAPAPPPSADIPAQQGDQQQGAQQQDPPGRVARVQYMSGEVSIQPGGVNDWIAASLNRPLTTADRIWTDKDAKAELNVGDGFIRMNSETSVTLTNVSDGTVQVELDQGTLSLTVRHLMTGEVYEVDTPNYAFTVMKSGVYRFDVYPNEDQSWVTVRSGYGVATGRGSSVRVNSGSQVRFSSGNSLQHTAESAPARDGFDDWVQVRDKRLDDSVSARYVSPGVIGYQDLDGYGRWQPTPSYGNVWVPYSVPSGWAPYRYGHWVWIAPWGWTWVDDQPWGFAPFHYGRWVYWGGGWAWAPGPVGYWNPYYAPALVGWIGGPGFGVGFGFGGGFGIGINFGWFPLGWGEPFYPRYCGWGHGGWYRGGGYVSNNYIRNVNVTNTNITNINNVTNNYYNGVGPAAARYGFRNTPGAVTAAPKSAFTSGAAINRVGGAVPRTALNQGTMLRGVDVNPTREAVLGGHAPQNRGVPPASAFNRPVVTSNRPAAVRPASLETANQATVANGNLNALNRGSANVAGTNAAGHPTTAVNGRGTQPVNPHGTVTAPTSQARGPVSTGSEARTNTPTSMGGHYVPRPPSAGGNPTVGTTHSGVTNSNPGQNGSSKTAGNTTGNTNGYAGGSGAERAGTTSGTPRYGSTGSTGSTVPRPPQTYQGSREPTAPQGVHEPTAPQHAAPSQTAPSHSGSSGSKETTHGDSPHGPGAALSVPRPPATYSYRPAPGYSASAGSTASRPLNSYGAGSRSGYTPSQGYTAGRSSTQSYTPSRSYSPAPAAPVYRPSPTNQGSRGYSSAPVYASRGTGSYSAPRSGGGAPSSYRPPTGGGGSGAHYSGSASSAHSSGGGGSHASSGGGGGGGHHGR